MAPMSLPPGFRFHPTDEELVAYYLDRKINGGTIELEIIPEVDLYKCEPWDLPEKSFLPSKDMEWYFYSPRDRKYPNGSRTNRATRAGYWKATGKDRAVQSEKRAVGMKKTLVYYRGRAPHGVRTNWVMHEYRLIDSLISASTSNNSLKDSYALCRIFKKTIHVGKNKEEEINANGGGKESGWGGLEEQLLAADHESDRNGREAEDENCDPKFPSDTSSSDLTQGTPFEPGVTDELQSQFLPSDHEAISSANLYSLNMQYCSSDLIQQEMEMEMEMGDCTMLPHYQFPYPPLALEDFPQINITELGNTSSKCEIVDDLMMYDRHNRDCSSGTSLLEEIFF